MWRIAIIDDDRQLLQGMKRAIPWKEIDAEWCGEAMNGEEGLHMIERVRPDVIITDIYMPIMNGLDMIERLRGEGYGCKIIILSGYSDFEYARQALRLNVSDYISKPVSIPTMKAILDRTLGQLAEEEGEKLKQNELQQKLELYEPLVEKEWVKSAVAGTSAGICRSEDLPVPYRFWVGTRHVMLGVELVRESRACELGLSDWHLFRFATSNIVCEVALRSFPHFEFTELHGGRSALVIHPPAEMGEEVLQQKLEQLGIQLIDCVRRYLKLVIRVGIGRLKEQWQQIPDSTEEAFRAIDLKERHVAGGYYLYTAAESADGAAYPGAMRPVKFYQELASAIKTSQQTQAQQVIREFTGQLEQAESLSPEYLQMLAGELWGIVAYNLYEVGMVLEDIFPNAHIAKETAGLTEPAQLAEWLTEKITIICSSRQWRGNSKHRQAVDFITQYIHEHYMEEITLGDLTDKVFISRNHLAIIFKNMTGETFNTYLTRVRIEKSKELLLESNLLVYEVAEKVGYKNVPYFSTLFKKHTGMNPTELVK
ncbi:response regulator transcription factor [Paenibacillus donghaensis]|uniref:DNA-binding response regulator n=1 Tax=Paenibacillus donghaensis TaxID=414771 RepID=A0A2Z2KB35_9BACL|nr:response regulator transcription factor [Paenibacillus donghaensis]ASA23926.1 DNA-binding response regulator [Paenibacillus donghaensis]